MSPEAALYRTSQIAIYHSGGVALVAGWETAVSLTFHRITICTGRPRQRIDKQGPGAGSFFGYNFRVSSIGTENLLPIWHSCSLRRDPWRAVLPCPAANQKRLIHLPDILENSPKPLRTWRVSAGKYLDTTKLSPPFSSSQLHLHFSACQLDIEASIPFDLRMPAGF